MRYVIILLIIIAVFMGIRLTERTLRKSKNFLISIKKELNINDVLGEEGCGNIVEKSVDIEPFEKLKVSRNVKVILEQSSDTPKILIKTDENLQDNIKIKSENKVLYISLKENINKSTKNEIHLTYQTLKFLKVSAGGYVKSKEEHLHNLPNFKLDVSSGANVKLKNMKSENLECNASTGANLYLSGNTKELKVKASTGANVKLDALLAESCDAKATTGANIKVYVLNKLKADASTAGNIKYKGNPQNINKDTNSGGVVKSFQ